MSKLIRLGATLPPALEAVLNNRRRTYEMVSEAPSPGEAIRAALIGPGVSPEAARSLLESCEEAEAPVLVFGAPAAELLGTGPAGSDSLVLRRARLTEAGSQDDVTAATMPGAPALTSDPAPATAGDFEPLLVDEQGDVLLARQGLVHATLWRLDVDLTTVDDTDLSAEGAFVVAHAAALLGRWLDAQVGRTDEEKPWGRRGPQPVPAPGLSLNPA